MISQRNRVFDEEEKTEGSEFMNDGVQDFTPSNISDHHCHAKTGSHDGDLERRKEENEEVTQSREKEDSERVFHTNDPNPPNSPSHPSGEASGTQAFNAHLPCQPLVAAHRRHEPILGFHVAPQDSISATADCTAGVQSLPLSFHLPAVDHPSSNGSEHDPRPSPATSQITPRVAPSSPNVADDVVSQGGEAVVDHRLHCSAQPVIVHQILRPKRNTTRPKRFGPFVIG